MFEPPKWQNKNSACDDASKSVSTKTLLLNCQGHCMHDIISDCWKFGENQTLRAQRLTKIKIALRDWNFQARSEIENFKRTAHEPPYVLWGVMAKRDWTFQARLNIFKRDWFFKSMVFFSGKGDNLRQMSQQSTTFYISPRDYQQEFSAITVRYDKKLGP